MPKKLVLEGRLQTILHDPYEAAPLFLTEPDSEPGAHRVHTSKDTIVDTIIHHFELVEDFNSEHVYRITVERLDQTLVKAS